MFYLPQSGSATVKLGPFVDSTDGVTAETSLTISGTDVRLSKNGGNFASRNDTSNCPHDEIGFYDCSLNSTDLNTIGRLLLAVNESGAAPVWHEFMIVHPDAYSLLASGTYVSNLSNLDASVSTRALQTTLISVSGSIPTKEEIAGEVTSSGNAANWSGVADISTLALQSTLETVSGDISNLPTIDTIVSSGNAANWSGFADVSNLALQSTLLVISGDISNLPTIDTIISSGNSAGWSDGATANEVWTNVSRTLTDYNESAIAGEVVQSGNVQNWSGVADISALALQSTLITVSGYTSNLPTIDIIISSGNAEGWNTDLIASGFATYDQLDYVSGLVNSLPGIDTIITSGNAANWSGVADVSLLALQSTLETVSGDISTLPNIDTIITSGNAAGWSNTLTASTISGLTPPALSQIVASGDAAGWGVYATSPVTISGWTVSGTSGLFDGILLGALDLRTALLENWAYAANDVDLSGVGSGILHAYYDPNGTNVFNLTAMPSGRFRS